MDEIRNNLNSQFVQAANTLTQFYMQSIQEQQRSYNCGVKATIERIKQTVLNNATSPEQLRQMGTSNGRGGVISVDLLMNVLNMMLKETLKEEKGKSVVGNTLKQKHEHSQNSFFESNHNTWNGSSSMSQSSTTQRQSSQSDDEVDRMNFNSLIFTTNPENHVFDFSVPRQNNNTINNNKKHRNSNIVLSSLHNQHNQTQSNGSSTNPKKRYFDTSMDCSPPLSKKSKLYS